MLRLVLNTVVTNKGKGQSYSTNTVLTVRRRYSTTETWNKAFHYRVCALSIFANNKKQEPYVIEKPNIFSY